uniref:Rho/rac guanine nucleotide exchange factor (GEF) 18a n=1 Tax=Xiphophorus maculatus TaxID=8083 RepID=M3ZE99_XIPMA
MDETEGQRVKSFADESALLAEPINPEDSHYAELQADLESDSCGLEAESWSSAVDQNYLMSLNKEAVKRQDVIYELIQTEMNHVRTLKILLHIYMYELKQFHVIVWLEKLFPGLEVLLSLHHFFLNSLKSRQFESADEDNRNNYCITQLADILINQFSGSLGKQMTEGYGYFCSHHSEAVNFYKKQMQNNKKLQILIRKIDQLPLVRRLTIPECFLLVTQRITKYPVLLERIIQNTDEEHRQLEKALELIKHTISQVNTKVSECEKTARVREIIRRLEQKSQVKLKDGRWFRREDLLQGNKTLLHEGPLIWKSSGKQKEIIDVCLYESVILNFQFTGHKPPVIYLQRVIVREVAQEERGMYVICTWPSGSPEMYELYTSSKEECKTWMDLIRDVDFVYVWRIKEGSVWFYFSDKLQKRDELIKKSLEKKQDIFAELYNDVVGQKTPHGGLLLRGDASDLQQGEALLSGAIEEGKTRKTTVKKLFESKSKLPVRSNTDTLLEKEKERNLEKQKEELAKLHKQQVQHQAEQQHWEKEREKQQVLIDSQNAELQQREEECRKTEEKLKEKELELRQIRETYQQDLERLRETTQKLERDRESFLLLLNAYFSKHYSIPSALVFTGNSPDPAETPPRVPPRSTSIRMSRQMLPVQLMSTTNQVQKPVEVQQKIPRKLAAEPKGKEKIKSKHSHKRAHSAANIDVTQVVPIRVTGKNGGSLKAQISTSPKRVLSSGMNLEKLFQTVKNVSKNISFATTSDVIFVHFSYINNIFF